MVCKPARPSAALELRGSLHDEPDGTGIGIAHAIYVIHEGAGVVRGRLAVFDVGVWDWCGGHRGSAGVEGVSGLCPGLGCRVAGLGRSGQAPFPRAGVFLGAGWWRLTRRGESGIGLRVGWFTGLWWLGAGSLTVFRRGRRLQSSIRSRGADQSVVRCSGAQSSGRPSCSKGRRRPDRGASSPEHAPHAVVVSASVV